MAHTIFGERPEPRRGLVRRINVVSVAILVVWCAIALWGWETTGSPAPPVAAVLIGLVLMQSPRIAHQWERSVVLRLGRFVGLRGPGLFWVMPFADRVSAWVDQRTVTTSFPTALHLRAMNMLYEGLKEKGALMLVPSSAVESMGMGGLMGAAALRQSGLVGGSDTRSAAGRPPE